MNVLTQVLNSLALDWVTPRRCGADAFVLTCRFEPGCHSGLLDTSAFGRYPDELKAFWSFSCSAELFRDVTYGQWGLSILSPSESESETADAMKQRPHEFAAGDLVIGRFIGDSDYLVIRCDAGNLDFGSLLVATPLDERTHWYRVAGSLTEFLTKYADSTGDKYWE